VKITRLLILMLGPLSGFLSLAAQITNVNIGGSYDGTFMITGSGETDYEIAGSPYLSETWMYGTLEMKSNVVEALRKDKDFRDNLHQYQVVIAKIDAVIRKLSDPDFEPDGLALSLKANGDGDDDFDLRLTNSDFEGMEDITSDLRERLLLHMEKLKGEYEAEINDFFKLRGLFRYNLYAQEFEMIHDRDTFSINAPFNIRRISISNMEFMYGLYVKRTGRTPQLGSAYFQVLNDGECKLLRRHEVTIKSGSGPVTYSWAGSADTFVHNEQLYYQAEEGGEVSLMKNPRKIIRKLFATRSEEIENYIKSRKLNMHRDEDLAKVFDYYNHLDT
jgi:hypothetical protein